MSPVPSGLLLPAHPEFRELRPRFPPPACSPTTNSTRSCPWESRHQFPCSIPSRSVQLHRDFQNWNHRRPRLVHHRLDHSPRRRLLQGRPRLPAALPEFRPCPIQRM